MCIKSCELTFDCLVDLGSLVDESSAFRPSEDTVFYRFAYRASRVLIYFEMGKFNREDLR
jgi:hypothetical protein